MQKQLQFEAQSIYMDVVYLDFSSSFLVYSYHLSLSPTNSAFSRWNTFEISKALWLGRKKKNISFSSVPHIDMKPHLLWAEVLLPEKQHVAVLVWWPRAIPGIQWRRLLRTFCATLEWIPQPRPCTDTFPSIPCNACGSSIPSVSNEA